MMDVSRASRSTYAYQVAKEFLLAHGYADEIRWQQELRFCEVSEQQFLRESAWVVLAAGMRESIVRKVFSRISHAFHGWHSAAEVVADSAASIRKAKRAFNHARKLQAIADIAEIVNRRGFDAVKSRLESEGPLFLREFPYIGPITCFHLAKNLGVNVVKPDRHLLRVSVACGYLSPGEMCDEISEIVGDAVAVVDLVIWRYATLDPYCAELFADPLTLVPRREPAD
jgi:hypothetical protein